MLPLYEATLYDDLFHDFQHFSFVVAACLFWRVLLDPVSRLRLNLGAGAVYLFLKHDEPVEMLSFQSNVR